MNRHIVSHLVGAITVLTTLTAGDELTPWAEASDNFVDVWGGYEEVVADETGPAASIHPAPHMQRIRAPECAADIYHTGGPQPCPGDPVVALPECGELATLPPLWERPQPEGLPGPWTQIGGARCASAADLTPALVAAEFRRLPLTPSALTVQPGRGWVLVNKATVVYADPAAQTRTTTILGIPVRITATPTGYAWDFGDGTTLATRDPGRPWPDADLTHTYTDLGTFTLRLTTTWSATYAVDVDPTVHDVPGTATTTSTFAVEVRERRAHLVAETCTDDPAAPGC